jgi:hypothetical protein
MQTDLTRAMETGPAGRLVEVRQFSNPQLQASINNALAGLDARAAILHLEANPSGLNAAIAANIDGHWSVALGYSRGDWGWAAGTSVKFAW